MDGLTFWRPTCSFFDVFQYLLLLYSSMFECCTHRYFSLAVSFTQQMS